MADADADTDAEEGAGGTDAAGGEIDELVAEIAATDEGLAAGVADLAERLDEVEGELEARDEEAAELRSRLKRERANFQNYKKRAKRREDQLRERATADLVERLLDVRDNLVRALEQDDDAEIRDGVEATLATFDRVLEAENVSAIEPDPGDGVDPERHEVVLRTDSEREAGLIDEIYRPGYEQAGTVLRPAQVTVSESSDTEDGGEHADDDTGDDGEQEDGDTEVGGEREGSDAGDAEREGENAERDG